MPCPTNAKSGIGIGIMPFGSAPELAKSSPESSRSGILPLAAVVEAGGRVRCFVIVTVLVLVGRQQISGFHEPDLAERGIAI